MITIKKMKTFVLSLALMTGVATFAQAPEQMLQQEPTQTEVKAGELESFADVSQKVIQKSQEGQQEMLKEIENEGLTGERYQELHMAQNNPAMGKVEASDEELAKKEKVDAKLEKLEQKLQEEQVAIVEGSGMTVERYQEIAQAVQTDQSLMEKYRKIMIEKSQQ